MSSEPSPQNPKLIQPLAKRMTSLSHLPQMRGVPGAATEPDSENQKTPLNGVVSDLGGVGEEDARYKIETLEARVGSRRVRFMFATANGTHSPVPGKL